MRLFFLLLFATAAFADPLPPDTCHFVVLDRFIVRVVIDTQRVVIYDTVHVLVPDTHMVTDQISRITRAGIALRPGVLAGDSSHLKVAVFWIAGPDSGSTLWAGNYILRWDQFRGFGLYADGPVEPMDVAPMSDIWQRMQSGE